MNKKEELIKKFAEIISNSEVWFDELNIAEKVFKNNGLNINIRDCYKEYREAQDIMDIYHFFKYRTLIPFENEKFSYGSDEYEDMYYDEIVFAQNKDLLIKEVLNKYKNLSCDELTEEYLEKNIHENK